MWKWWKGTQNWQQCDLYRRTWQQNRGRTLNAVGPTKINYDIVELSFNWNLGPQNGAQNGAQNGEDQFGGLIRPMFLRPCWIADNRNDLSRRIGGNWCWMGSGNLQLASVLPTMFIEHVRSLAPMITQLTSRH